MSEVSYPHSTYNGGAVSQLEYAAGINWASPSGLIGHPTDTAPLYISGGQLYLRAGVAARILGMAYENEDDDLPIDIEDNAGGAARPDHVVLRLDWTTMLVRVAVLEGTPGGTLPPLSQTRPSVGTNRYEVSLGSVSVPAGGTVAGATLTRLGWYIGSDGQILCTSTTRPPHYGGRAAWEVDNGREIISTGNVWRTINDDTGLITPTLATGWSGNFTIRRRNGAITIHASPIARTVSLAGGDPATITTGLDPRLCPPNEVMVPGVVMDASGRICRVSALPNGTVLLVYQAPSSSVLPIGTQIAFTVAFGAGVEV